MNVTWAKLLVAVAAICCFVASAVAFGIVEFGEALGWLFLGFGFFFASRASSER